MNTPSQTPSGVFTLTSSSVTGSSLTAPEPETAPRPAVIDSATKPRRDTSPAGHNGSRFGFNCVNSFLIAVQQMDLRQVEFAFARTEVKVMQVQLVMQDAAIKIVFAMTPAAFEQRHSLSRRQPIRLLAFEPFVDSGQILEPPDHNQAISIFAFHDRM